MFHEQTELQIPKRDIVSFKLSGDLLVTFRPKNGLTLSRAFKEPYFKVLDNVLLVNMVYVKSITYQNK